MQRCSSVGVRGTEVLLVLTNVDLRDILNSQHCECDRFRTMTDVTDVDCFSHAHAWSTHKVLCSALASSALQQQQLREATP
jgi:hypothetical protein